MLNIGVIVLLEGLGQAVSFCHVLEAIVHLHMCRPRWMV